LAHQEEHCVYHAKKPQDARRYSNEEALEYWTHSGKAEAVKKELSSRFAAVSYSTFSWPFQGKEELALPEGFRKFPRDYAVLIPISSRMTVRSAMEQPFEGYIALFFDGFPDIADRFLELIVTLPELLSAICSAFVRRDARISLDVMSYTQEMRTALCARKVDALNASSDDTSAYDELIEQSNSMLLKLDERLTRTAQHEEALGLDQLVEKSLSVLGLDTLRSDLDIVKIYADNLPAVCVDPASFVTATQCVLCQLCIGAKAQSSLLIRTVRGENNTARLCISYSPVDSPKAHSCLESLNSLNSSNTEVEQGACTGLLLSKKIFSGHSGLVRVSSSEDGDVHIVFELPFYEE
jgi:hypothetical protein